MHTVFERVRAEHIEVQDPRGAGRGGGRSLDPRQQRRVPDPRALNAGPSAARLGRHLLAPRRSLPRPGPGHEADPPRVRAPGRAGQPQGRRAIAAGRAACSERRHARRLGPAMGHQADARDAHHLIHYQGQGNRLARGCRQGPWQEPPPTRSATVTAFAAGSRGPWASGASSSSVNSPGLRSPGESAAKPGRCLAARARGRLDAWGWTSLAKVAWTSLAAKPWGSLRVRAAAVAAVAVAAVGIGITVTRGPSASSSSNSHAAVASVPELPLAALSKKIPRESHPARDQGGGQHARHRSTAPEPTPTEPVAPPSAAPRGEAGPR